MCTTRNFVATSCGLARFRGTELVALTHAATYRNTTRRLDTAPHIVHRREAATRCNAARRNSNANYQLWFLGLG